MQRALGASVVNFQVVPPDMGLYGFFANVKICEFKLFFCVFKHLVQQAFHLSWLVGRAAQLMVTLNDCVDAFVLHFFLLSQVLLCCSFWTTTFFGCRVLR